MKTWCSRTLKLPPLTNATSNNHIGVIYGNPTGVSLSTMHDEIQGEHHIPLMFFVFMSLSLALSPFKLWVSAVLRLLPKRSCQSSFGRIMNQISSSVWSPFQTFATCIVLFPMLNLFAFVLVWILTGHKTNRTGVDQGGSLLP